MKPLIIFSSWTVLKLILLLKYWTNYLSQQNCLFWSLECIFSQSFTPSIFGSFLTYTTNNLHWKLFIIDNYYALYQYLILNIEQEIVASQCLDIPSAIYFIIFLLALYIIFGIIIRKMNLRLFVNELFLEKYHNVDHWQRIGEKSFKKILERRENQLKSNLIWN